MINRNHGHIVALSSMAGMVGLPYLVPYCASKFAVRGLMEALHEELREDARGLEVYYIFIQAIYFIIIHLLYYTILD